MWMKGPYVAEPDILWPWAPIWSTWVPNVDQMNTHGHKMFGFDMWLRHTNGYSQSFSPWARAFTQIAKSLEKIKYDHYKDHAEFPLPQFWYLVWTH